MTTLKERVKTVMDEHGLSVSVSEIIETTIELLNCVIEDTQEHESYAINTIKDLEKARSTLIIYVGELE